VTDDPGTVLVVDGGHPGTAAVVRWLRGAGYRLTVAAGASGAVHAAAGARYDAILLDPTLPEPDGIGLRERLKALPGQRATPIIHLGATPACAGGRPREPYPAADVYLAQPLDRREVLATVRAVRQQVRTNGMLERLAARLGELAQVSVVLGAATTLDDLLSSAAAWTARIFGCPAVVCAEDFDGRRLAVGTDGPQIAPRLQHWSRLPDEPSLGSRYQDEPPALWPMVHWPPGDTVRVVVVRPRRDRPPVSLAMPTSHADEGSPVLTQLGYAVATGIEAVRAYDEERALSLTLQHSLLPNRLPEVPGVDLAVRYLAASTQAEIGGDFYELSELGGRLFVAVGDVAGHSLHAATVMAELRHALRAYLAERHPVGQVLERLNQLMLLLLPDEVATVCLASLDPVGGDLRVANAGHPPPMISLDGEVRLVTGRSPLLGLRTGHDRETVVSLPVGATLLLYTDGLVERRGEDLAAGLGRLSRAAATVEKDLELFCDRILAEATPAATDDIALVALRRR
jgi:CheY-like chemotaxis protein